MHHYGLHRNSQKDHNRSEHNNKWRSSGMGRFWKRILSKSNRALAKGFTRERSNANIQSTVNWRND